jgi:hypothetical protein
MVTWHVCYDHTPPLLMKGTTCLRASPQGTVVSARDLQQTGATSVALAAGNVLIGGAGSGAGTYAGAGYTPYSQYAYTGGHASSGGHDLRYYMTV